MTGEKELDTKVADWWTWAHSVLLTVFDAARLEEVLQGFEIAIEGRRNFTRTRPDGTAKVTFRADSVANPFTIVHEFAHAYHTKHWPAMTENMPTVRAEAAAMFTEYRLLANASRLEFSNEILADRLNYWAVSREQPALKEAQDIALRAIRSLIPEGATKEALWPEDIHETLEKIMWGEYDGGSVHSQVAGSA